MSENKIILNTDELRILFDVMDDKFLDDLLPLLNGDKNKWMIFNRILNQIELMNIGQFDKNYQNLVNSSYSQLIKDFGDYNK